MLKLQYLKINEIEGPLIVLEKVKEAFYGEIIEIEMQDKTKRTGKVILIEKDKIVAQVFEGTFGISTDNVKVKFTSKPLTIPLNKSILGRTFNGVGKPIDNYGDIYSNKKYDINGYAINPFCRIYPQDFIQTGISSIDVLTTLIRGQKLPIFSANGLSHNEIAAQIIKQAKLQNVKSNNFCIVFAAMGIKNDDYSFFKKVFEETGALERVCMYVNLADDPVVERISTPRCALSAAEYLAFEENMHVLVIISDMTSYCEALREISSAREEVPSRKGYPGYLYSDLASLYERAGIIQGKEGSVTLLPILTMPNDDITHPIPDLTGYITEGQIVLSRDLFQKDIYPPVDIQPSLSRLMKDGIGEGFTRDDHEDISSQLFSSYSRVKEVRALAQIIGEDDLSKVDKAYMHFGRKFEEEFLKQEFDENRSIFTSLDLAWEMLKILPKSELDRLDSKYIKKYMGDFYE